MIVRFLLAAPCFVAAAWLATRSWNPLGNGYFGEYRDSPDGLYLTVAGTGFALAGMLAAAGLAALWDSFRRRGGLGVVGVLAVAASLLPALLFKWTSEPDTWPWAYFVDDPIAWLRIEPKPREVGLLIQAALAAIASVALAVHLTRLGTRPSPRPRAP